MVIRTLIIDDLIQKAVVAGADTVVNLGAGLDARPYRMALPESLRWIEVDYPQVIDWKADKLADPLMLHIAEEDQFVPKEAQKLIAASLKNHPQVEIFTYPGRDHAFARPGGEHYDAADAAKANARTLAFFQKALG